MAHGAVAGEGGQPVEAAHEGLQATLKQRHLSMIALGGVIGAGLFVGSSAVIAAAGPSAVVSYLLAGILVVFVMRMLGEMAAANPSVGSFAEYARRALGGWAGFSVGWLYWYFWVVVIGFEAVAGAVALDRWFDFPLWVMALVPMMLLTATNLISVKSFGEFEFWFASIKVVAIVAFLLLGLSFVSGVWPGQSPDVSNLTAHGGFTPNGLGPTLAAMVIVILAFIGAEIVTIQPWNTIEVGQSPFVSALGRFGISGAADIMNGIVVVAVLSCLNSGIYTASRMLFALARRGDAPHGFLDVNTRGVPVKGILICTVAGYVAVAMAYISPDTVFDFMVNSSGALGLVVYMFIAFSQLRLRRDLEREAPGRLRVKMWGFPYITYFSIFAMGAIFVAMALQESTRKQALFGFLSVAVVVGIGVVRERRRTRVGVAAQPAA